VVVSFFSSYMKLIFLFNLALQSKIIHPFFFKKIVYRSFNCYFFFITLDQMARIMGFIN
jgi:hypothetical protein